MVGMSAIAASGKYTDCRVGASIVANADLTLGDRTRELLEAHRAAANGRLVGVRHTAKWDQDLVIRGTIGPGRAGLYLEPNFQAGFKLLGEMGMMFDASIYHPQLPDVIALARANPQVPIVVIRSASPLCFGRFAGQEKQVHRDRLQDMKELATCPNVSVGFGGLHRVCATTTMRSPIVRFTLSG
jgi:predicted TIM-barrel fold metal-dependent hydrolase